MTDFWFQLPSLAVVHLLIVVVFIPWVLASKRDPTAAVAWCLAVLLMPLVGALLFWTIGYNAFERGRKRSDMTRADGGSLPDATGEAPCELGTLALRAGAYPVRPGNAVRLYHDTGDAYRALLSDIEGARTHVHLQFFIFRPDATGNEVLDLLTAKAREGVEVRLLIDGIGSLGLKRRAWRRLKEAGGQVASFLPLDPLRSRLHVNLRNHRKVAVIDGQVGFTGGMNIGDEYLGKSPHFGYWRDSFLRVEGPAVADLHAVFRDDWQFTTGERLGDGVHFPVPESPGDVLVQVAESGPGQEYNAIRQIYFMAILHARERLWIASPYFVPDNGLLDALRTATYRGVDVRLLSILRPDHYLSFYASRYYWSSLVETGVRVYQYARGMMHSKLMLVDGQWGMVGSANLDCRSLHLNFEAGCILHDVRLVGELEAAYQRDLEQSHPLDHEALEQRSLPTRALENACRLLTPNL